MAWLLIKQFRGEREISVSLTLAGKKGTGKDAYATWVAAIMAQKTASNQQFSF